MPRWTDDLNPFSKRKARLHSKGAWQRRSNRETSSMKSTLHPHTRITTKLIYKDKDTSVTKTRKKYIGRHTKLR